MSERPKTLDLSTGSVSLASKLPTDILRTSETLVYLKIYAPLRVWVCVELVKTHGSFSELVKRTARTAHTSHFDWLYLPFNTYPEAVTS
eukprot:880480-Prorocentrum_minimum.AAC.1